MVRGGGGHLSLHSADLEFWFSYIGVQFTVYFDLELQSVCVSAHWAESFSFFC